MISAQRLRHVNTNVRIEAQEVAGVQRQQRGCSRILGGLENRGVVDRAANNLGLDEISDDLPCIAGRKRGDRATDEKFSRNAASTSRAAARNCSGNRVSTEYVSRIA